MPVWKSIPGRGWVPLTKFTKKEMELAGITHMGMQKSSDDNPDVMPPAIDETTLDNSELTKKKLKKAKAKRGIKGGKKVKRVN